MREVTQVCAMRDFNQGKWLSQLRLSENGATDSSTAVHHKGKYIMPVLYWYFPVIIFAGVYDVFSSAFNPGVLRAQQHNWLRSACA